MKVAPWLILSLQICGITNTKTIDDDLLNLRIINEDNGFIPDTTIDVFVLLLESKGIVENFKNGCEKYGGYETFNIFKESMKNFVNSATKCENRYRIELGKKDNQIAITAISEIIIFVKEMCSFEFIPNLSKATRKLINSYGKCKENKTDDRVGDENSLGLNIFEYVCKNNGSYILDILEDDKSNCRNTVEPLIDDCVNKKVLNNYAEDNAAQLRMNLLTSIGLSSEYCRYIEEIRNCYVEPLRGCKSNEKIVQVADELEEIFEKNEPCQKLMGEKLESKSSADSKNVLSRIDGLITIVFTVSLLFLRL